MPVIRLRPGTHKALVKMQGLLLEERGERVTFDDIIASLLAKQPDLMVTVSRAKKS